MYKNSARFKKRNTYAFRAKETTVNAISVHNNTWNKNGRENKVSLLYLEEYLAVKFTWNKLVFPQAHYLSILSCVRRDREQKY